jgi:hypothetical protein
MPLPTKQFEAQARRAGRTISWRLDAMMTGFLAGFVGLIGLVALSTVIWIGIVLLLTGVALAGYGIRRVCVGRYRDLICPNCGCVGEILKIQQSYQFHCPQCDQTADTGIDTTGGSTVSGA